MGKCKCVSCDCNIIHKNAVNEAKNKMPNESLLLDMADFFKVMSDSTRIRILAVLSEDELCVCDICSLLNMTKSAVSHQLQNLKQSHLIKCSKRGKEVFYSLADEHVKKIFEITEEHISEKETK